jgi:hypothetical protein
MWWNRWSNCIAVAASITSLVVSLVTFFYAFILQVDDIKVFGSYPILSLNKQGTSVAVRVKGSLTFSNSGNRAAVIENIVIGALVGWDGQPTKCDYRAIYHSVALKVAPVEVAPNKVVARDMEFDKRFDLTDQTVPSDKITNVTLCGVATVVSPDVNYDLRVFSLGGADTKGSVDIGNDAETDIDAVPMQSLLHKHGWSFKFLPW